jgi:adenosine deaminase
MAVTRDLRTLPKAHLHLHLTGSMRPSTLLELADRHGVRLPDSLTSGKPPELSTADDRGWFRFQRLYDIARSVLRTPEDVRRVIREAAADDAAEGSGRLEMQIDPSSYAPRLGGLTPTVELLLDAAREAESATGVSVGIIIAANRTKHPFEARTLARLAARYADRGVVGFGLSNDERRGTAGDFETAFRIARNAGLIAVPHGGELAGPRSVADCVRLLGAVRLGHGVRAAEDERLLEELAERRVVCEVCPASNTSLGVFKQAVDVPVRALHAAGVPIALGADDPLLFGSRLLAQYESARAVHGLEDAQVAALARDSITGSTAPDEVRRRLLAGVDDWLRR